MTSPRRLLTAVCNAIKPHELARIVASPQGPVLIIRHVPIGVVPPEGKIVHVDRRGVELTVNLEDTDYREASCACGRDFLFAPANLSAEMKSGRRRVVLQPVSYRV